MPPRVDRGVTLVLGGGNGAMECSIGDLGIVPRGDSSLLSSGTTESVCPRHGGIDRLKEDDPVRAVAQTFIMPIIIVCSNW